MLRRRLLMLALALLSPQSQAIMAGSATASPADSPAARVDAPTAGSTWSGVVAISIGSSTYSGVLVASRYVLTAAHVAAASASNPSAVQVVFNLASGQTTQTVTRIEVFPGYSFPADDLALIELAADAPSEAQRYAVLDTQISLGTSFTMVGYGASGYGNVGVSVGGNASTRRVGENLADYYVGTTPGASFPASLYYFYDFDTPGKGLGNKRESMVAVGDSGSPAFVTNGNAPCVMGINNVTASSSGTVTFTFGNIGGGIVLADPRFISWLREKSSYEIRMASDPAAPTGDAPLPLWAAGLLGAGLMLVVSRHTRR